ncbi:putative Soluble guanylate cyclase 88E [Hypsibius exemplaris]|uniref:Soluble guanylate cyclase 88E n=1 Tax=Hypsibius exemplaris TaxID=2072580 RepID=A0A9X6RLH1_HYPEX|nr:putative Soluble guanylate cyclase 88E [Hypsibius exemplaris]
MSTDNTSTAVRPSRKTIRQSILSSFQTATAVHHEHPGTLAKGIKVVPYINGRQVLGITILILWPIILGTVFNIYGFEEASAFLKVRLDVEKYQARVERVQGVIDKLVTAQDAILQSLLLKDGKSAEVTGDFGRIAQQELDGLDKAYPELKANHKRVTPKKVLQKLNDWLATVQNFETVDPTILVDNLSSVIKGVRMFFSVFHATSLQAGDTWNNVLQELFISEVNFRIKEVTSFGHFTYGTSASNAMSENLRLTLIRRYQRSLTALDLYYKYSLPEFQIESLQKSCKHCNWTYLRTQKTPFWRGIVPQVVALDKSESLQTVLTQTSLSTDTPVNTFLTLMKESLYPVNIAQEHAGKVVRSRFHEELNVGAAVFGGTLTILVAWILLTTNLLGLVARSLAGIFSESYRFQWVQLCRRRAIERETSRSDKIVAEMFFEMNFKYLYEGNLPPMVMYKEATIAFVELLQYDELCKIYTTVDHVAILDWYYHMVSAAVKGFNTNIVATAGHYCLLAGTHAYHPENVALSMLRLMTLVRESYLPPPHNTKLPLIRCGIHSGPVVGAIVSLKFPLFTMLGDTVNTAARMNSKAKPYCVLLSETANNLLEGNFVTQSAGVFNVKGKGAMQTYWLLSCKWQTFAENFVDLGVADELQKIHDLKAENHENLRRTGLANNHAHSLFEKGAGRRSSSSVNDGSIAGLGGDLLQSFIRAKKRKKSKRVDRILDMKMRDQSGSATRIIEREPEQNRLEQAEHGERNRPEQTEHGERNRLEQMEHGERKRPEQTEHGERRDRNKRKTEERSRLEQTKHGKRNRLKQTEHGERIP